MKKEKALKILPISYKPLNLITTNLVNQHYFLIHTSIILDRLRNINLKVEFNKGLIYYCGSRLDPFFVGNS